ncbi:hypothetical protein MCOR27_007894 [Pyricularia oryzae]|uniref:Uncharacterized protein n=3 Tax=Pyricularia oryzae TaxID=318829 RepID=G4NC64_PYRO7|nr:uncharacterized protein MGG_17316 [Pyricularia oryzae 70-15]ELQ35642.1 hypothetical protein OOU_Y34scaffold00697g41 [Pyricularia oryzae Y34]KAH8840187.1 hypothetical protein MCOR01_006913 [Pyricularia oryzae]EHA48213.1 hypothetical protein MGG_17316 [Pyricularia oryzae 70-15]KAI6260432.1 hypothetical protein MCOR19_003227 [Pyricularia oryzae]KAI6273375.1 hypothetical protein MCOR27_007894 [Pyricularia oryzae]
MAFVLIVNVCNSRRACFRNLVNVSLGGVKILIEFEAWLGERRSIRIMGRARLGSVVELGDESRLYPPEGKAPASWESVLIGHRPT